MPIAKKKSDKAPNLSKEPSTIHRRSAPTIYDQLQQGTNAIVAHKDLYIQTSPNENRPCWVLMGPYTPSSTF